MLTEISSPRFDEFEEALYGIHGRHVLVRRASLAWKLGVLELDGVSLMHGRNGARSVYQGSCAPGTFLLFLPLQNLEGLVLNGMALGRNAVGICPPGLENRLPSTGGMRWLAVTMDMDRLLRDHDGERLPGAFRRGLHHAGRIDAGLHARLAQLVLSAFRTAAQAPQALAPEQARAALRSQLLDACLEAGRSLDTPASHPVGRPRIDRTRVMDRVLQDIEARIGDPILVGDLCARAGVSLPTLQNVFAEQFGVSPHRYLMLRRLHAIHRGLRNAGHGETVTSVCGRYGIWEFGRFAAQYRHQFGVSPGDTLRQRLGELGLH